MGCRGQVSGLMSVLHGFLKLISGELCSYVQPPCRQQRFHSSCTVAGSGQGAVGRGSIQQRRGRRAAQMYRASSLTGRTATASEMVFCDDLCIFALGVAHVRFSSTAKSASLQGLHGRRRARTRLARSVAIQTAVACGAFFRIKMAFSNVGPGVPAKSAALLHRLLDV